jgi:hypothetical protein
VGGICPSHKIAVNGDGLSLGSGLSFGLGLGLSFGTVAVSVQFQNCFGTVSVQRSVLGSRFLVFTFEFFWVVDSPFLFLR